MLLYVSFTSKECMEFNECVLLRPMAVPCKGNENRLMEMGSRNQLGKVSPGQGLTCRIWLGNAMSGKARASLILFDLPVVVTENNDWTILNGMSSTSEEPYDLDSGGTKATFHR